MIIAVLGALAAFVLLMIFISVVTWYRKCPSDRIMIIYGKTGGNQAARCADYAVQQFRDLVPLLLLHGRYSMVRTSQCIKYSFYKNVAFIILQYAYGFYCLFSGRTVYDDFIVMLYNSLLTLLPPFFLGVFEKDIPEHMLLRHPELYRGVQSGKHLRVRDLLLWTLYGLYQVGVFLLVLTACLAPHALGARGIVGAESASLSTLSAWATTIALCTLLTVGTLVTRHWVVWTFVGFAASVAVYFIYWAIAVLVAPASVLAGTMVHTLACPVFYLALIGGVGLALAPLLLILFARALWWPNETQIINELVRLEKGKAPTTAAVAKKQSTMHQV